jgi:putative ABC transport system substrate-binding protein
MKFLKQIVTSIILLSATSVLAGQQADNAAPAYADWFGYDDNVSSSWVYKEVETDPHQLVIHRKGIMPGKAAHRIFIFYPRASSAYNTSITSILNVFDEKNIDAEFTVFNFRKDTERGQLGLALAAQWGADLMFSMGSESTAWLYKTYSGGDIPVVSVCSKDPVALGQIANYEQGSGTNFAFTSLNMPVKWQMSYILELKPNLKNLGILVDNKNISAVETQARPIADYVRPLGIQVLDVSIDNPERASEELATKVQKAVHTMRKSDPLLENSIFWITGSTAVFREIKTINEFSDRVPVLSLVPDVVKAGNDSAVMAIGITFDSNAQLAAFYGADVLSGRVKVEDIKVGIVSPPDIAISWRKSREIGLDIPFSFFESASFLYDYDGKLVRYRGKQVTDQDQAL